MRLTDDPCIVTGAQGVARIDQKGVWPECCSPAGGLFTNSPLRSPSTRSERGVAVVAYKVKELLTVEGKSLTIEAADSSTWVRRDLQWVVCASHGSALGDPFARDRQTGTSEAGLAPASTQAAERSSPGFVIGGTGDHFSAICFRSCCCHS